MHLVSCESHPNIAKFFGCGIGQKGNRFIVMEISEMSLFNLIQKQAKKKILFPLYVAIEIIAQLARGDVLSTVHGHEGCTS